MPRPISFGNTTVGLTLGTPTEARVLPPDSPMRLLVLGDFTGRHGGPGAGHPPLNERSPVRVDRDNVEQVMAKLGIILRIPSGGHEEPLSIAVREMDHFHPDHLWKELPAFQSWRQLRRDLGNPSTFERAADKVRAMASAPPPAPAPSAAEPPAPAPVPQDSGGSILDQMLGEIQGTPVEPERPRESALQAYIRAIVEPHVIPRIDQAQKSELEGIVDRAAAQQLRDILHHPTFQTVEAAWRSLHFLVRRLETDASLQIHFLDVSKDELAADLMAGDDLTASATYDLLVERVKDRPWGVAVGLYVFGPEEQDVQMLGRLAQIASRAQAPFLGAASSRILGCTSLAEKPNPRCWQPLAEEQEGNWQALRQLPEAEWLGLALPRWLLRLPYGKNTSSVEAFPFEEWTDGSSHESYLWGNSGVLCAYLLASAFSRDGWGFRPGGNNTVEGLPVHVYREDGEPKARPCAEVLLHERALEAMLNRGLMPLVSVRDHDSVRLARFQSLVSPITPLAGRWATR